MRPLHAWQCRCGCRNAPQLPRCRRCSIPQSSGKPIYAIGSGLAAGLPPSAAAAPPARRRGLSVPALLFMALGLCGPIAALCMPPSIRALGAVADTRAVEIVWYQRIDNTLYGRVRNVGRSGLLGVRVEGDVPIAEYSSGFYVGDRKETAHGEVVSPETTRYPVMLVGADLPNGGYRDEACNLGPGETGAVSFSRAYCGSLAGLEKLRVVVLERTGACYRYVEIPFTSRIEPGEPPTTIIEEWVAH